MISQKPRKETSTRKKRRFRRVKSISCAITSASCSKLKSRTLWRALSNWKPKGSPTIRLYASQTTCRWTSRPRRWSTWTHGCTIWNATQHSSNSLISQCCPSSARSCWRMSLLSNRSSRASACLKRSVKKKNSWNSLSLDKYSRNSALVTLTKACS